MGLSDNLRFLDQNYGLSDVILPFLLVFIFIYAVLQKTKILGEDQKKLNIGVAIIIGLIFVIPHVNGIYPADKDPVSILNQALPQISLILVAIVFLLILIGVFGQDMVFLGASAPGWVAILAILGIVVVFGGAAGWWDSSIRDWLTQQFGTEALSIFIMILVFGVIVAFITGEKKEKPDRGFGIDFNNLFGKK
tara:strand:- start:2047 stop:2625 length:579 start_codon:yes stop_codon:yes gene_type:complete